MGKLFHNFSDNQCKVDNTLFLDQTFLRLNCLKTIPFAVAHYYNCIYSHTLHEGHNCMIKTVIPEHFILHVLVATNMTIVNFFG